MCSTMQCWLWFTIFAYAWAQQVNRNALIQQISPKPSSATLAPSIPSISWTNPPTTPATTTTTTTTIPSSIQPSTGKKICGLRNVQGVGGFRVLGNKGNKAEFGEFPWMTAVLRRKPDSSSGKVLLRYRCGGSLIHPRVVLTAAHCVKADDFEYTIRAGEWDINKQIEPFPYQERKVQEIILHPDYYSDGLYNDIALLILEEELELDENIQTVCLPRLGQTAQNGRCYVTGWGLNSTGSDGVYQGILKKIQVPIVSRTSCQEDVRMIFRTENFKLHESFLCAGGGPDNAVCKGDAGGPLMCKLTGQGDRFFQAGIVSWEIGCGQDRVPGLYTDVGKFISWIDEELKPYNIDKSFYTY